MLTSRGYQSLATTQCVYGNHETDVKVVAHVDDFLCLGSRVALDSLLADLRTEYECSGDILGPGVDEVKKIKLLGRTITYTPVGLEWEGDQKHCRAFVEKLGLKPEDMHWVNTPGVKVDTEKVAIDG